MNDATRPDPLRALAAELERRGVPHAYPLDGGQLYAGLVPYDVRVSFDAITGEFWLYRMRLGNLRHGVDAIAADLHHVLKMIDGRL